MKKFESQQSSQMYKSTPSYPPINQVKFESQQSSQMYKSMPSYQPIDHYSDLQLSPPAEPTPSYPVHSPILMDHYSDSQLPPPIEYHRPCPPLESPPTSRAEKLSMSSLSPFPPQYFPSPMPPFGSPVSDDTPTFSSSYDDDSSKLLDDESDGSTHPRSPLKQRNFTKKGNKSRKNKIAPLDEKIYPITEVFNLFFLRNGEKKVYQGPTLQLYWCVASFLGK